MFNNHDYMEANQSRSFMQKVYGWMALALGVTATVAYTVASTPAFVNAIYKTPMLFLVLALAQIGLVIWLSAGLHKMSTGTAMVVYLAYSALSGVTLSSIFLVYELPSIGLTFFVTAGMFAAMAIYGYVTKSDLSSLGGFLTMGIIGLILANIVNIFVGSESFSLVTAAFGVMIFTLFTAYDVQMIKRMGNQMLMDGQDMFKVSLFGALKLYLDFVNLFLYLLRFFGQQRRN